MSWFFIALGAPFLWAFSNIIDKYLVEKYSLGERGSGGLVLFSSLIGIFFSLLIFIFTKNVFNISYQNILILVLTGALSVVWIILYLYALELDDTSNIAPWFLTVPVFGYVIGYIFLGESLKLEQVLGSILVIFGAIILSFNFISIKKRFKTMPVIYMIGSSLIIAIIGILFKYVTLEGNFWVSSFWEYTGLGISGIILYFFVPNYRLQFNNMLSEGGMWIISLNTINEVLSFIGNLMTNFALLLAPVALVYSVGNIQPAIVLLYSIIGTIFWPKIIKEDISKKIIIPKIVAIIIMIIGSFMLV